MESFDCIMKQTKSTREVYIPKVTKNSSKKFSEKTEKHQWFTEAPIVSKRCSILYFITG